MSRPRLNVGKCKVEACHSEARTRGFCRSHYTRLLKYNNPLEPSRRHKLSLNRPGELLQYLHENHSIDPQTQCWVWNRGKRCTYGYLCIDGTVRSVHRVSAVLHLNLDIHSQLHVLHTCDNPPCFNPDHLFIGTAADNVHDMMQKGRMKFIRPEDASATKLVPRQIRVIRKLRERGCSYEQIAERFPVLPQNIQLICERKIWKHVA